MQLNFDRLPTVKQFDVGVTPNAYSNRASRGVADVSPRGTPGRGQTLHVGAMEALAPSLDLRLHKVSKQIPGPSNTRPVHLCGLLCIGTEWQVQWLTFRVLVMLNMDLCP